MRISVLAQVPSEEPLRRSALAMRESPDAVQQPIDVRELKYLGPLEIDPLFPAIPLGEGAGQSAHESMATVQSESFAVRATIEVQNVQDIPEKIDGKPLFSDPRIEPFPICASSPALGKASDVAKLLGTKALNLAGVDGSNVAVAIVDGGINLDHLKAVLGRTPRFDPANSWRPPLGPTPPFSFPVGHGTMCAYDALIAAPNATLLDVPVLGRFAGGSVMSGSLSAAVQAYSFLLSSWAVAFAAGGLAQYNSIVLSNSWGMYTKDWDFPEGHRGRYCDNPDHPFDVIVSSLVRYGVDIVFAAGNCGADCPSSKCDGVTARTIMGANAHGEVLTIAGCDTKNRRVGYSSTGPSIEHRAQEKPDLTGYTHFKGSQVEGANAPDSGTSAACPVVAGVVAALRSKVPASAVPPTNLAAILRSTAKKGVGQAPGAPRDDLYGSGIVDPVSAAQALGISVP